MGKLLEHIDTFNRKERYFLFAQATGNEQHGLRLSAEFLGNLGEALGLSIPEDARGYIDYHLDWLHAAVVLADGTLPEVGPWKNPRTEDTAEPQPLWVARGTQEDIDLLVCYEADGQEWVLLLEAKGDSSWTNKQLKSKMKRLGEIFGPGDISVSAGVQPRFCLMSPSLSRGLISKGWPKWMRRPSCAPGEGDFAWLPLRIADGRRQVMRCDKTGMPSKAGEWWTDRAGKNQGSSVPSGVV